MTPETLSRLLVMTTEDLAAGYRLAGADVVLVADAAETAARLCDLLDAGVERGVIAVHEPFHAALDPALHRRLDDSLPPLVVALPSGVRTRGETGERERLLQMLWQAVGYGITFDAETAR